MVHSSRRRKRVAGTVPFLLALLFALAASAAPPGAGAPDDLETAIGFFLRDDDARRSVHRESERRIGEAAGEIAALLGADSIEVAAVLRREILGNLGAKRGLRGERGAVFPMSSDDILRTVVNYETFKMKTYVRSGVFPKRYFGYVDKKWDTAAYEETLLRLSHGAAREINAWQEEHGRQAKLTDAEIIITWLSEGGALLLRENTHLIETGGPPRIDLELHHGCDNMGLALDRYPDLTALLDERFGTALVGSGRKQGRGSTGDRRIGIGRRVDYRESIVATALMYLYEKEITAEKLARRAGADGQADAGWGDLAALPPDEQFILTSLVFNTGLLFPRSWVEAIRDLDTIHRLYVLSEENSRKRGDDWRPPLPVDASPPVAFDRLAREGYRAQPTSWQGAYHVLQRYSAYRALRECTDLFDSRGDLARP